MLKKYVSIPRRFLVINVCNLGKTLCSPCITFIYVYRSRSIKRAVRINKPKFMEMLWLRGGIN